MSELKVYRFLFFTPYYFIVFIIKYRNRVVSVLKNEIYVCENEIKIVIFLDELLHNWRTRFSVHSVHLFIVCVIILSVYVWCKLRILVHSSTRAYTLSQD